MCGICGWALLKREKWDNWQLRQMAEFLTHRGHDDRGFFSDDHYGIGLAHNRLSIIDLSEAGHQPMISEDESYVLVYNGELYNFRELRKELEELGHSFKSRSDTEVILRSLIQWGHSCVKRFYGMFAFALWAREENKLLLARDPMGMKPLYYASLPGDKGFMFASEIKAFLALADFKAKINTSSLHQFLEFGYVFDKHQASLEGVYKLPPGHMLEVVHGRPKTPKAFFPPSNPLSDGRLTMSEREYLLYTAFSEVIPQHLIADVPIALLLSGGLDSSLTAAFAAKQSKITTITMGFAESQVDERPYAKLASDYIGSDHIEVTIYPHEITEKLEEVVFYFDDLFADWGTVSTRIMYKKCHEQGIKVVLVGEGSDEIFGGYPVFRLAQNLKGPMFWKLFMLYRCYCGRRYGILFPKFFFLMRKYLRSCRNDLFHAVRLFESRNQLPNNYVMKVDKASMSVGVEARAPFLDRRIVELAYKTPSTQLLSHDQNKWLLRSMTERYKLLPHEIIHREKYGASMAASWMDESEHFRNYARDVILSHNGWIDKLNMRKAMTDYFDRNKQGYSFPHPISIFKNLAWRLLLLNLWSRKYLCTLR